MGLKKYEEELAVLTAPSIRGPEDLILEKYGNLFIFGEISTSRAEEWVKSLHRMAHDNDVAEIRVYINSPGGDVMGAISVYETLREIEQAYLKPSFTTVMGEACSAAPIILQAGTIRAMTKTSILMVHEMSYLTEGNQSHHDDYLKGAKMVDEIFKEILCSKTRNKSKIEKLYLRKESYLSPSQCKSLGLIDKII